MTRPGKPAGLVRRAETKKKQAQRADKEASLRPERALPIGAPARLDGHEVASATWRRVMRTYNDLEAEIVTRLDQDLLVDYCMLVEQLTELDVMRKKAYQVWLQLSERHQALMTEGLFDDAVMLAVSVVGAFDAVVKLDGRSDRKRALLLQLRQSLYLTPRARAGAAPTKKAPEEPPDELSKLLNEFSGYVNGAK